MGKHDEEIARLRADDRYIEPKDMPDVYGVNCEVVRGRAHKNNVKPFKNFYGIATFYLRSDVDILMAKYENKEQEVARLRADDRYIEPKNMADVYGVNSPAVYQRIRRNSIKCFKSFSLGRSIGIATFYLRSDVDTLMAKYENKEQEMARLRTDDRYIEPKDMPDVYGVNYNLINSRLHDCNVKPFKRFMGKYVFYLRSEIDAMMAKYGDEQIARLRADNRYIEPKDMPDVYGVKVGNIKSRIRRHNVKPFKSFGDNRGSFYLRTDIDTLMAKHGDYPKEVEIVEDEIKPQDILKNKYLSDPRFIIWSDLNNSFNISNHVRRNIQEYGMIEHCIYEAEDMFFLKFELEDAINTYYSLKKGTFGERLQAVRDKNEKEYLSNDNAPNGFDFNGIIKNSIRNSGAIIAIINKYRGFNELFWLPSCVNICGMSQNRFYSLLRKNKVLIAKQVPFCQFGMGTFYFREDIEYLFEHEPNFIRAKNRFAKKQSNHIGFDKPITQQNEKPIQQELNITEDNNETMQQTYSTDDFEEADELDNYTVSSLTLELQNNGVSFDDVGLREMLLALKKDGCECEWLDNVCNLVVYKNIGSLNLLGSEIKDIASRLNVVDAVEKDVKVIEVVKNSKEKQWVIDFVKDKNGLNAQDFEKIAEKGFYSCSILSKRLDIDKNVIRQIEPCLKIERDTFRCNLWTMKKVNAVSLKAMESAIKQMTISDLSTNLHTAFRKIDALESRIEQLEKLINK